MKFPLILLVTGIISISAFSQGTKAEDEKAAAYTKTINSRADKIVATLGITDAAKRTTVRDIISGQYRNLNDIYNARDEQIKAAIAKEGITKEALASQLKQIEQETTAKTDELHKKYILALEKKLDASQVEKVKDGMTYGVLNVTYVALQDMIPTLKESEKKQIMIWLTEAREHAMDAESSDKKHGWFGKYKGKINNYLSAAGYDLTKERAEWQKRIEAAKASKAAKADSTSK